MKRWAIDTETFLIAPGMLAPKLVCLSYAHRNGEPTASTGLLDDKDGIAFVAELLDQAIRGDARLCLQHGVYDFGVIAADEPKLLPKIFKAYEIGAIIDTKERQKLIDLADGNMKFVLDADGDFVRQQYTLEALAYRHLGWRLQKGEDGWRLRYGELHGTPIDEWPLEAREYAVRDASATLLVAEAQDGTNNPMVTRGYDGIAVVTDEIHQLRAAWALHLQSLWGMRTDPQAVEVLQKRLLEERAELQRKLDGCGLFKSHTFQRGAHAGETKVTKSMKAIRARVIEGFKAQGMKIPLTDSGRTALAQLDSDNPEDLGDRLLNFVSTEGEVLEDSGDEVLKTFSAAQYGEKLLTSYVPMLLGGAKMPIRANYNLLLETGRTSCPTRARNGAAADPGVFNPQVLPRKEGVRECIVARPGHVICSVDFEQLELCTWSQVLYDLFGNNEVRDAINAGMDLHVRLGAYRLKIPYEEAIERKQKKDPIVLEARQWAKAPNFGYPGGMGPDKFIDFSRKTYNLRFTRAEAVAAKEAWLAMNPTAPRFFEWAGEMVGDGYGQLVQFRSGRIRGGVSFTQCCNSTFQGLAADGAKEALWAVARACYLEELGSPLYGSRPIAFVHDEILAEVPEQKAHQVSYEMSRIMITAMKAWVPDVKIEAKPALMRRWSKKASDPVFNDNGYLIPYEDWVELKARKQVAA